MRIWIRIKGLQNFGSNADPDPKPWTKHEEQEQDIGDTGMIINSEEKEWRRRGKKPKGIEKVCGCEVGGGGAG